jgi:hypothetical protein
VAAGASTQAIGDSLIAQGFTAVEEDDGSITFIGPDDECPLGIRKSGGQE